MDLDLCVLTFRFSLTYFSGEPDTLVESHRLLTPEIQACMIYVWDDMNVN